MSFYWALKSLISNLRKRKFKAIFRFIYDSKYRAQIQYMRSVAYRSPEMKTILRSVSLESIVPGHDINYPDWVQQLVIMLLGGDRLPTITVTWDEAKKTHIVVDGNHRFAAYCKVMSKYYMIQVWILVPDGN